MGSHLLIQRPSTAALLAFLGASMVAFLVAFLLLATPDDHPRQPAATVRFNTVDADRSQFAMEAGAADVLHPDELVSAMQEARYMAAGKTSGAAIDTVRDRLRIDIGVPNDTGVQTATIRWIGDARQGAATRLVNVLAHRLAAKLPDLQLQPHHEESLVALREVKAAEKAVDAASRQLQSALAVLNAALAAASTGLAAAPSSPAPPIRSDDSLLVRQQLSDLEVRRQNLAERLTPEHPQMKSLDEKISQLRSTLSAPGISSLDEPSQGPSNGFGTPPVRETARVEIARAEVDQAQHALQSAHARYRTAQSRQRTSVEALMQASRDLVAEIDPALAAASVRSSMPLWKRSLLSAITALACGGLAIAVWPRPRAFATAEEVRAVTHLPVVVIESAALN